jgi:hypothetical protein
LASRRLLNPYSTLHCSSQPSDTLVVRHQTPAHFRYRCVNGAPWTSLLAVSVQLCDHRHATPASSFVLQPDYPNFPTAGRATAASASCGAATS